MREDLRTRLGWGPTFALQPLSDPEVRAALRREADRRGILLGDRRSRQVTTWRERAKQADDHHGGQFVVTQREKHG